MIRVPGFTPSVHGLRFTNSWPQGPDIIVHVPPFGDVPIGDASNGLCGGMAFLVKDLHEANRPPIIDSQPANGTPLFKYIVARLFASFNIPGGILKYYGWMNTPDEDTGVWRYIRRGVTWMTIKEEWPRVKADIDAGHTSPLGVVTVRSGNPNDLGKCHQVLAYGYDLTDTDLTLHVCDPNTKNAAADDVFIKLDLSQPTRTASISHNINIGHPVRGFFRVDYSFSDPSKLQAAQDLRRLTAVHSGKVLDVSGLSDDDGAPIQQWAWLGGENQQWEIVPVEPPYVVLLSRRSGKALDVAGASTDDGAAVIQWEHNDGDNQRWELVAQANGAFAVRAKHSGKVLDVDGGSTADGALLQQWTWHGGENQQFMVTMP